MFSVKAEAGLASQLAAAEKRIVDIKAQALGEVGGIAGEAAAAIVRALVDADVDSAAVEAEVKAVLGAGGLRAG